MKSASELFIEMREREAFFERVQAASNDLMKKEYTTGKASLKKYNSADEESDIRRDQETDDRFNGQMMGGEL